MRKYGVCAVGLAGILMLQGCATKQDILEAKNEVFQVVGKVATRAAIDVGVETETAEAIGDRAGEIGGKMFEEKVEEKASPWSAIGTVLLAGANILIQFLKGAA